MSGSPNGIDEHIKDAVQLELYKALALNPAIMRYQKDTHDGSADAMSKDNEVSGSIGRGEFSQYEKRMDEKIDHIDKNIERALKTSRSDTLSLKADFKNHRDSINNTQAASVAIIGLLIAAVAATVTIASLG